MINFTIIGSRLKERREQIKMSQEDLTKLLENNGLIISIEMINQFEKGLRYPNVIEIKAICDLLGISTEEIMKENEELDLVSLFRSQNKFSVDTMAEIVDIQDFIKDLIAQKKIKDDSLQF